MGILVRQHGNSWIVNLNEEWLSDRSVVSYLEDKGIPFVEAENGSSKVVKMRGSQFSTLDYAAFVKVLVEVVGLKEKFGKVKYRGEVA